VETALKPGSLSKALLQSFRLHQWAKNALIFVPLVLAGRAGDGAAWLDCAIGFLAWGLVASAAYIVNDLKDIAFDRQHPTKRHRPIARGDLPLGAALAGVAVIGIAGFIMAGTLGFRVFLILAVYAAASLAYSFSLKRVPIPMWWCSQRCLRCALFLGLPLPTSCPRRGF
jgi:4-hydroxybenzoate polyprenyltransferase